VKKKTYREETVMGQGDAVAVKPRAMFDVGIHEKLPFGQLLLLGFQNIFGMTGIFVFPGLLGRSFNMPPEQIAYLYGMTFVTSGLTTCFQSVGLLRMPIVQGPYFGTFIAILIMGHSPGIGLGTAYGSLFVACLIWAVLAVPIRGFSIIGLFGRFFQSSMISGLMVILISFQIASVSLPNWLGLRTTPGFPFINLLGGFIAVVVFILVTLMGTRRLRRTAILLGLVAGTLTYSAFLPISFTPVVTAPWLVVPQAFPFGFGVQPEAVFLFVLVMVPCSITCMPLYQAVASWMDEPMPASRMAEGCFGAAIGSAFGAVVGSFAMNVYPDNIGMLRSTRVGSRYATLAAGVLLVVLGCFIKFDMLLVLVPIVVLGGLATILFGIVLVHGIHLLNNVEWHDRNLIVAGSALMIGLGGLFISPDVMEHLPLVAQLILKQSAVTGGITMLILDPLLNSTKTVKADNSVKDAA
jgi:xanthine/uracil permease